MEKEEKNLSLQKMICFDLRVGLQAQQFLLLAALDWTMHWLQPLQLL